MEAMGSACLFADSYGIVNSGAFFSILDIVEENEELNTENSGRGEICQWISIITG